MSMPASRGLSSVSRKSDCSITSRARSRIACCHGTKMVAIVPRLTGPQFHLSFNGSGKPPNQGDNRGKADHEGNGAAFLCGHLRGPSLLRPRVRLAEAGLRPEGSHLFPVKLDAPELAGLKVGVVHAFKDD
jgi:hypothetical protein